MHRNKTNFRREVCKNDAEYHWIFYKPDPYTCAKVSLVQSFIAVKYIMYHILAFSVLSIDNSKIDFCRSMYLWQDLSVRTNIFYPVALMFELTYFMKTLTLPITFEQWALEFSFFTGVFLLTRPFRKYQHFWPCDIDLWVWHTF